MLSIASLLSECLDDAPSGATAFAAAHPEPMLLTDAAGRAALEDAGPGPGWSLKTAVGAGLNAASLARISASMDALSAALRDAYALPLVKQPGNPWASWVTLGRTRNNDICLNDGAISKLHAYFVRDAASGRWQLVDAGSRNGTRHNGRRLAANSPAPLGSGDTVGVGACQFTFYEAADLYRLLRAAAGGGQG